MWIFKVLRIFNGLVWSNFLVLYFRLYEVIILRGTYATDEIKMQSCHGRDNADFSQLGGGVNFSLNVTDVTVTVMIRTFP
jgi:hypothetical protein